MTGPNLFSVPFFSHCFGSVLTELSKNTNNTRGRRGGGAEEEMEERDAPCVMVARGDKLLL